MDRYDFERLMQALARAWSSADPRGAVACFAEDIVYIEPPDRQRYVGLTELYELSGGDQPGPMSMTWHHLVFDPERQIGTG
ncbi:MAG: nuclear transport factor 2 family protein, partial [Nonomuraea sp.]|nr:nuclear transport factor 2 family protein [Nonomuraea sp.]